MMQGEFTLFWPNGKLRQKKKFNLNGKTDGQVTYYYPNGNKELVFESNNGIENGSASWYYENGDKKKDSSLKMVLSKALNSMNSLLK